MTPTGSKQRPTATRDPKESTTRTRPRQRAPPFRYWGKRSPKRQTKQALAIASLSGWRSVSRLLATVVTIDNKAVDRGGCGCWTWRNLCSLGTPHLCPYLHQRRLFTRAPTLTLRRNISATEADIWKNRTQAQTNTSREISWHEKTTRIAIKVRFYRVQSAVWWKLSDFVTPEVCRVWQKRIAVQTKGRRERKRKGKEEEGKERGRERKWSEVLWSGGRTDKFSNKLAGDVACLGGSMVEHQPRLLGSRVWFPAGAFAIFSVSAKASLPISLSPFPFLFLSLPLPFPSSSSPFDLSFAL